MICPSTSWDVRTRMLFRTVQLHCCGSTHVPTQPDPTTFPRGRERTGRVSGSHCVDGSAVPGDDRARVRPALRPEKGKGGKRGRSWPRPLTYATARRDAPGQIGSDRLGSSLATCESHVARMCHRPRPATARAPNLLVLVSSPRGARKSAVARGGASGARAEYAPAPAPAHGIGGVGYADHAPRGAAAAAGERAARVARERNER